MIAFKLNSKFEFIYINPEIYKNSEKILKTNIIDILNKDNLIEFFQCIESLSANEHGCEKIDFEFNGNIVLGRILGNIIKTYNKDREVIFLFVIQAKYKDNEYYEEKVRELDVLYSLNSIFEDFYEDIDIVIKNIILLLKNIYNRESVSIHLIFDDRVYKSDRFIRSSRFERVTIRTNGIDRGRIEVFHNEDSDLKQEEYNLLKQVGVRLGSFIEKYEYLKKLNILEYAMTQTKDGVAVYSFDRRIEYCNKACLNMHGYNKIEEVEGKSSDIFYDDDHNNSVYFNMRKELLQHGYFEGDFYHKKSDGTSFRTFTTTTVLRKNTGAPSGYISIIRDVSDIDRKIEEVDKAEENYKTVTEAFDGYIYTVDEDRNIIYYNSALEDKMINSEGKKCYNIMFDLDDVCSWCELEDIKDGKNIIKEIYNAKEDKYYRLINFPVYYNDKMHCTAMLQDITESKRQDLEIIEQKEKALKETLKKTFFINNISFDLRTPLSVILGYISIIKDNDNIDDITKNKIDGVYQNALIMNNVLDEMTDINLIEAGEIIVHEDLIRPSEFIKNIQIINENRYSNQLNEIDFIIENTSDDPGKVYLDSGKIIKLMNAIFGIITKGLKTGYIKFGVKEIKDEKMYIDFIFSGELLSDNCIEDLFRNLLKENIDHSEINEENCVAGVDAILSRSIIKLLNIKTSYFNDNGVININFEIPIKKYEMDKEEESASVSESNDKLILLAEDNDANYRIMDYILKKNGYKVIRVSNGLEAVETFKEKESEIGVILMDISMDIMNGFEAAEKIKEIQKQNGTYIPIIANTAFGMLNDKKKCLESGCDDYVSKPIKKEILLQKIAYWLKKRGE